VRKMDFLDMSLDDVIRQNKAMLPQLDTTLDELARQTKRISVTRERDEGVYEYADEDEEEHHPSGFNSRWNSRNHGNHGGVRVPPSRSMYGRKGKRHAKVKPCFRAHTQANDEAGLVTRREVALGRIVKSGRHGRATEQIRNSERTAALHAKTGNASLCVRNIPNTIPSDAVKSSFEKFGKINRMEESEDPSGGYNKYQCTLHYESFECCLSAFAKGRQLEIFKPFEREQVRITFGKKAQT